MATTSQLVNVINALVAAFDAAAVLDGVTVVKGRQNLPAGDLDYLFVASDGAPDSNEELASSEIEWAGLGALARTETGQVTCAAVAQTGDQDDMAGRMDRADALMGACETILKADLTLTGQVTFQSAVNRPRLFGIQNISGCAARLVFDVTFQTRI